MIESKSDKANFPVGPSIKQVGCMVLIIAILVGGFLLSCYWSTRDIPDKEAADDAAEDAGSSLLGSDLY